MARWLLLLSSLVVTVPVVKAAPPTEKIQPDDEKLLKTNKIGVDEAALLDYFRKRTITAVQREQIDGLIRLLGHDSFKVREKATEDLLAWGTRALPQLRLALKNPDEEIRERAREGIAAAENKSNSALTTAVVRVLRVRASAEAVKVLLDYLPDAESEAVTEEALLALAVLGVKDNKVNPLLIEALKDKQPQRRAAAALVAGRSGSVEQRRGVQPLLADADVRVRFRAAQGLLAARERSAIPIFIALLTEAPQPLAGRAEEMLSCIAGSRSPRQPLAISGPPQARIAWEQWWKQNPKFDLSRADVDLPPFNPTLLARDTARQFVAAAFAQDKEKLAKLTQLPFQTLGEQTFTKREQLEGYLLNVFQIMLQNFQARGLAPTNPAVLASMTIEEYAKTAPPAQQQAILKMQRKNLRVVLLQWPQAGWTNNTEPGDSAVFVRVGGEQPQVVAVRFSPQIMQGAGRAFSDR